MMVAARQGRNAATLGISTSMSYSARLSRDVSRDPGAPFHSPGLNHDQRSQTMPVDVPCTLPHGPDPGRLRRLIGLDGSRRRRGSNSHRHSHSIGWDSRTRRRDDFDHTFADHFGRSRHGPDCNHQTVPRHIGEPFHRDNYHGVDENGRLFDRSQRLGSSRKS